MANKKDNGQEVRHYAYKVGAAVLELLGLNKQVNTEQVITAAKNGTLTDFLCKIDDNDFTKGIESDKAEINEIFEEYFANVGFIPNEKMDNCHIYHPQEQGLILILNAVIDIMLKH